MGRTRELFRKITDTKGIFHAKMGTIKEINSTDLTESKGTKEKRQGYTKELYKKILVTQKKEKTTMM